MKKESIKYWGFTIIELLTVTVILGILIPSIITIYSFMIKSNKEFNLRQTSIQQWYEFFEKLNILMQDYTIDYEEYFNRQMVWCVKSWSTLLTWDNFKWNVWLSWYCTEFTAYWNKNSTKSKRKEYDGRIIPGEYHDIYNCSSNGGKNIMWLRRVVWLSDCWRFWSKQSFWQYAALFTDVKEATSEDDDEELWQILNNNISGAIADPNNIQELYLISHDWKNRLFFRRKLVTHTWNVAQYKIQMLRLRWFDAWQKHSFTGISEWSYDRHTDTRACDTSMWFYWSGASIWWAYEEYNLPADVDDCWVDLTYWNTSVPTRNLSISPLNDPDLYWADSSHQINPYMKILLVNGVYLPTSNSDSSINSFNIPIETTINMKDSYKE